MSQRHLRLETEPAFFNEHLSAALAKLGYTQSKSDPCVFFKSSASGFSIVAIVVDDMLHAASSRALLRTFSAELASTYKMTHLGVPKFMIGIKISISDDQISLCQEQYIDHAVRKFGQQDAAPVSCPANPSGCLADLSSGSDQPLDTAVYPYMSLVGCLLWVTVTRPDVQTAVSLACRHGAAPTMSHWRAAIRILRYLRCTSTIGLSFRVRRRQLDVSAFVDAGYGGEVGSRSRRGHMVLLAGCPILWTTRATSMVCQSTSEAEFVAANECVKDILWLRGILLEVGFSSRAPSVVFEDNQATIAMTKNHVVSARNRHFCIRMAWLREQAAAGHVVFKYVPSKENIADIFTKILPEAPFRYLRDKMMSPMSRL